MFTLYLAHEKKKENTNKTAKNKKNQEQPSKQEQAKQIVPSYFMFFFTLHTSSICCSLLLITPLVGVVGPQNRSALKHMFGLKRSSILDHPTEKYKQTPEETQITTK